VSAVILRTVKHRLAELMQKPGGMSIQAALDGADKALAAKAKETLLLIAGKVTDLEALPQGVTMSADAIEQAYAIASDIVDVSGCMYMPELFGAAYSLCEILDYFRTAPFSRSAFDVHIRALRLIINHGEGPAMQAMVTRLQAVKARVLKGRAEDPAAG
jgi:hypothetical protein